jgi:hypothetical protein
MKAHYGLAVGPLLLVEEPTGIVNMVSPFERGSGLGPLGPRTGHPRHLLSKVDEEGTAGPPWTTPCD